MSQYTTYSVRNINYSPFQTTSSKTEALESRVRELELDLDSSRSRCDHLRSQTDVLALTLEDSKSLTDRLTVLLGRHESNNAALQLALNYCDHMVEAYDVLVALVETEAGMLAAGTESLRQAQSNRRSAEVVARHLVGRIDKAGSSRSDSGCRVSSAAESASGNWEDSSGYSQTTTR